jgi:hypothetical protein
MKNCDLQLQGACARPPRPAPNMKTARGSFRTGTGRGVPRWRPTELACRTAYPDIPVGAYCPPGTAWDRLGTDKFFSPRTKQRKNRESVRPGSFQRRAVLRAPMKTRAARQLAPTIVGGFLLIRSLSGQRWDYAGRYAGLSGTKNGRIPLNPGYSRVIPHNEFQIFFYERGGRVPAHCHQGLTQSGGAPAT